MDWNIWMGKKIFLRTRSGRTYSGIVKDVDANSLPLIWITILDKYKQLVQFSAEEIVEIKEEE